MHCQKECSEVIFGDVGLQNLDQWELKARNSKVYLRYLLPNNLQIGELVRKSLFISSMCEIG